MKIKTYYEHDIRTKIALNTKLTNKERSLYLLFLATDDEVKEFLQNEKKNKKINLQPST